MEGRMKAPKRQFAEQDWMDTLLRPIPPRFKDSATVIIIIVIISTVLLGFSVALITGLHLN
jgi:hypothetical protein